MRGGWLDFKYVGKVPLIRPTELFGEDGKENEKNVKKSGQLNFRH